MVFLGIDKMQALEWIAMRLREPAVILIRVEIMVKGAAGGEHRHNF